MQPHTCRGGPRDAPSGPAFRRPADQPGPAARGGRRRCPRRVRREAAAEGALDGLRGIDIDATTIPQLQRLMDRHRLTSVQLDAVLSPPDHRSSNRGCNAVITVSPTALADARAADKARREGDASAAARASRSSSRTTSTPRGMPTTAGSWALAGSTPGDAFIVGRLPRRRRDRHRQGATCRSGRTSGPIPSSSGWSGIGGQTNMPYVLDRNPCGSSSGSGVAASADLATVAVGTETDGSIVCPSGANGVVGIKPTLGLLEPRGIVPDLAPTGHGRPDRPQRDRRRGPSRRHDRRRPGDPATAAQAGHAFTDYTQFLDADALDGARIGVWRAYDLGDRRPATSTPSSKATIAAGSSALGATIVDPVSIDLERRRLRRGVRRAAVRVQDRHRERTSRPTPAPGYPKTLQDLIDFNNAHPDLEGPVELATIFELAQATGGRADPDCSAARAAATPRAQAAIDDAMADERPRRDHRADERPGLGDRPGERRRLRRASSRSSSPSAISGYAGITVAGGLCRAAAGRRLVHRRPLG